MLAVKAESIAGTRRCFEARRKVALARWATLLPEWAAGTPVEGSFREQRRLFLEGRVVLGCFVKANRCLYERNQCMASHAGVTLHGLDPALDGAAAELVAVADGIDLLRHGEAPPRDPEEEVFAAYIRDDDTFSPDRPVPASLARGLALVCADTVVHKEQLPALHLPGVRRPVPLLVHPELGAKAILPFEPWSDELLAAWRPSAGVSS